MFTSTIPVQDRGIVDGFFTAEVCCPDREQYAFMPRAIRLDGRVYVRTFWRDGIVVYRMRATPDEEEAWRPEHSDTPTPTAPSARRASVH